MFLLAFSHSPMTVARILLGWWLICGCLLLMGSQQQRLPTATLAFSPSPQYRRHNPFHSSSVVLKAKEIDATLLSSEQIRRRLDENIALLRAKDRECRKMEPEVRH